VQTGAARVTVGGADAYIWPGGGITLMVDVLTLPDGAFGYVPTPALVAPLEFTMTRDAYRALGGHDRSVRALADVLEQGGEYGDAVRAVGRP
jgi:6-hydroxynicotinate reductase